MSPKSRRRRRREKTTTRTTAGSPGSCSVRYFLKRYVPGADLGLEGVAFLDSVSHHVHAGKRDNWEPVGVLREVELTDAAPGREDKPGFRHQPDGLLHPVLRGRRHLADVCKRDAGPGRHE